MQKISIFLLLLFVSASINAQVGIGTNSPNASASLDVTSSSKGFLPPRVALTSSTDVSTIASPATGLLVYCTGASGLTAGYYYYNGTAWVNIAGNGFVPYTGATGAVNLGAYDLTVNGVKVGRGAGQVSSNIALGGSAINGNSTSTNLIGIGNNTMTYTGGVGNNNIAIGNNSVFGGSSSIGIGYNTLANNGYRANSPQTDVGNRNIAIGDASLSTSGTINDNVSIGASAMGNASGYMRFNVAIGTQALYNMQGWHSDYISGGNIAIGYKSSYTTVGGTENTFVGHLSGYNNNSGSGNTSLGTSSLNTNISGNNNTAIGKNADVATSGLSNATALGYGASVSASNTIQLGNSSVTSVKTSGSLTAGNVTYPNVTGTSGQVLTENGSGGLTFKNLGSNYSLSPVITSNYNISTTPYDIYLVNSLAHTVTITLPEISTLASGGKARFVISDVGGYSSSNAITIQPSSLNTILGTSSFVLNISNSALNLVSDGVGNWIVF